MTPIAILKQARERLADPSHYTVGSFARRADGCATLGSDPMAEQWSGYGAIHANARASSAVDRAWAWAALDDQLSLESKQQLPVNRRLFDFFDRCSHERALAFYDRCICRLESNCK